MGRVDMNKVILSVDMFPQRMQDTVRSIDEDGSGDIDMREVCDMVEMFAEMKKANRNGEISIKTLPKEIQPTLKVFDVDGDGTVAPMELARAAELYEESKNMVKKLTKLSVALLILIGGMLGCICGMTIAVVEASKETKTDASGVTLVKGTDTPTASAALSKSEDIFSVPLNTAESLRSVKSIGPLSRTAKDGKTSVFEFTITGYEKMDDAVNFFTASGKTVTVTTEDYTVFNSDGTVMFKDLKTAAKKRALLMNGGFPMFTMDMGVDMTSEDPAMYSPYAAPTPPPGSF